MGVDCPKNTKSPGTIVYDPMSLTLLVSGFIPMFQFQKSVNIFLSKYNLTLRCSTFLRCEIGVKKNTNFLYFNVSPQLQFHSLTLSYFPFYTTRDFDTIRYTY